MSGWTVTPPNPDMLHTFAQRRIHDFGGIAAEVVPARETCGRKRLGTGILTQATNDAVSASRPGRGGRLVLFTSLRGRLLMLTVLFVLFAQFLIYPLLAAGYRNTWLHERGQAAEIASLAVKAAPDGRVTEEMSRDLLDRAQVVAVAVTSADYRELVLSPSVPVGGPIVMIDLRRSQGFEAVGQTIGNLVSPPGRFLLVLFNQELTAGEELEVLIPENALRERLAIYSRNMLVISIIISAVVGALVYFAIYGLVVRPMKDLTRSVIRFGEAPEGEYIDFSPGGSDEMRRARDALRAMQAAVSASFRQRKRLAELGESVAKINHDLRNSLTTAQLVSESLSESDDPRVRRAAPRLERAIQRAAALAEATLKYGRAEPQAPNIQPADAVAIIDEAASEVLEGWPGVAWSLEAPDARQGGTVMALADPDHLFRIIVNLVRNAAQALSERSCGKEGGRITGRIWREGGRVCVEVADNGPGVPPRIAARLFQPFGGSAAGGGSGLGLAISRELAQGMGGDLVLTRSDECGAAFTLSLPAA
jgi:signal transduction histidine kinase